MVAILFRGPPPVACLFASRRGRRRWETKVAESRDLECRESRKC